MKNTRGTLKPHNSSIVLHLTPIFKARNISNPYSFLVKIGIAGTSAFKMVHNKAVQINFNQLTALCQNLNCTPNDLFALREMELPSQHALLKLNNLKDETFNDIETFLKAKSLDEIKELLKKNID